MTAPTFRLDPTLSRISDAIAVHINPATKQRILGETLMPYSKSGSGKTLLKLSIYADGMRVVYDAICADGEVDPEELSLSAAFICTVATLFARTKPAYSEFARCSQDTCVAFLRQYVSDTTVFG